MKVRYIEAFRAMMECGTVSAAARALRISQPAMTKLIAQLQSELDIVLFEAQGGRLAPTAEAHALEGSMNRAWRGVVELKEAAEDVREKDRLFVRALPRLLASVGLQALHPEDLRPQPAGVSRVERSGRVS